MESKMSKGIIYIATGEKFVKEAEVSAESVKEHMPDVNIAIMTDIDPESDLFDKVIELDDVRHDFGDQVFNMDKTPYEKTIFLDTDIYLEDSIADIFELLERFDVALAHNQRNFSSDQIGSGELESIPESFPEYNSGVFGIRKPEQTEDLFEKWKNIYSEFAKNGVIHNQASLRQALFNSNVSIATLPSEYNCIFRRPGCVNGKVKVFHGRLIDIDGPGAGKSLEVNEAVRKINKGNDLRSFYRHGNRIEIAEPSTYQKFSRSLRDVGVIGTLKRAFSKVKN